MASDDDRDEPVSLHPLHPREALKALLQTKPANGNGKKLENGKQAKKPARSEKH